ncbi:MAG: hypothetical protein ABFR62_02520, partial [Bacteroidota bacterium]
LVVYANRDDVKDVINNLIAAYSAFLSLVIDQIIGSMSNIVGKCYSFKYVMLSGVSKAKRRKQSRNIYFYRDNS